MITMDQNEATTTANEQPQCQNLDECSPEMTPVPSTTQQSSSMPSVEKRRRRLQQAAAERRSSDNRHVGHSNERQWLDQSTVIVVGALLFLILILQKDKIINDIRRCSSTRTKYRSSEKPIQFIVIMATHTIFSPITYSKTITCQLFHVLLRGFTNPMGLPRDIWEFITFLCQDATIAGGRIYTNLFGVTLLSKKTQRKEDLLPELENEDANPDSREMNGETIIHQQEKESRLKLHQTTIPTEKRIRYDVDDYLPPAFLSNDKYPPGWLVYHPKYGVVVIEKLFESTVE